MRYETYKSLRYSKPLLEYALRNAKEFKICDRGKTILVSCGSKGVHIIIKGGSEYGPVLYSFNIKYSKTVTFKSLVEFLHVLVKSELTNGRVHLVIKEYQGVLRFLR